MRLLSAHRLFLQVLIALEAAPINPSDIGPLFMPSHGGIGRFEGTLQGTDENGRVTTAIPIPDRTWAANKDGPMVGRSNRVGNEGAGRVIGAGKSAAAQALKGKLVAVMGSGGSYSQHAVVTVAQCLVHNEGTTPEEAASSFVNPLTALGMVKTMHAEGHTGIVHTAAASQLGQVRHSSRPFLSHSSRSFSLSFCAFSLSLCAHFARFLQMLVKICLKDSVPLVNIVRRQEQVDLLKSIGAEYVVNSSSDTYDADLVAAMVRCDLSRILTGLWLEID
jgi:hypothetical protein